MAEQKPFAVVLPPNCPKPGQRYRHANGCEYAVIGLANEHSTNKAYRPQVVYQGDNGRIWARGIASFLKRMTLVQPGTIEHKITDRGPVEVSFLDRIGFKVTISESMGTDYLYMGYGYSDRDVMIDRASAKKVSGYLLHFADHGQLPDQPL